MELYKPKKSDKPGKVGMVKVKKDGKAKIIYCQLLTIAFFDSYLFMYGKDSWFQKRFEIDLIRFTSGVLDVFFKTWERFLYASPPFIQKS